MRPAARMRQPFQHPHRENAAPEIPADRVDAPGLASTGPSNSAKVNSFGKQRIRDIRVLEFRLQPLHRIRPPSTSGRTQAAAIA